MIELKDIYKPFSNNLVSNEVAIRLENRSKFLFGDVSMGHGYYHLVRTRNIALQIHEKEGFNG